MQGLFPWPRTRLTRLEKQRHRNIENLLHHTTRPTTLCLLLMWLCVGALYEAYFHGIGELQHLSIKTQIESSVDEGTACFVHLAVLNFIMLTSKLLLRETALSFIACIRWWREFLRELNIFLTRACMSVAILIYLVFFLTQCFPGPQYANILRTRTKHVNLERPLSKFEHLESSPPCQNCFAAKNVDPVTNTPSLEQEPVHEPHFFGGVPTPPTLLGQKPYFQTIQRFPSEDVELTCFVAYPLNSDDYDDPRNDFVFLWTFKNQTMQKLNRSARVQIVESSQGLQPDITCHGDDRETTQTTCWYKKQSLLIRRLRDEDFGTYSCQGAFRAIKRTAGDAEQEVNQTGGNFQGPLHPVGNFQVIQQMPEVRDVFISARGMMRVTVGLWRHHRHSSSLDTLVRHSTNKLRFSTDGLNYKYQYDTPGIFLYRWQYDNNKLLDFFENFGPQTLKQFNSVTDDGSGSVLDLYTFVWCAYSFNFGVHEFRFDREFTDEKTGRRDVVVYRFPLVLRQAPSYPGILGLVDEHGDSTFYDDCWQHHWSVSLERCVKRSDEIYQRLIWQVYLELSVFIVLSYIFLFSPFITYTFLKACETFKATGSFSLPEVRTLCGLKLEETPFSARHRQAGTTYDVFLSYHQHDSRTATTVKNILRARNLRVFDSQQDVLLGEQRSAVCSKAVASSASIVVVASPSYADDPELNDLQFRCLYDCMLHGEVPEDRLVLVKVGDCRVLPSLGPLPVVDVNHPRWRRQLYFLCEGEDSFLSVRYCRDYWRHLVNFVRDIRDLSLVRWSELTALVNDVLCLFNKVRGHTPLQKTRPCLGGSAFEDVHEGGCNGRHKHDVLLSFCSESIADVEKAVQVKAALQGEGLSVFDEVKPGQPETLLVNAASACLCFVIVLSPAYRRDPLTRRLHFPQLLRAVESGR